MPNITLLSSNEHHDLLFDYYNFPAESYLYKYEGRGDPILAGRIHNALEKAQITSRLDDKRGWDHGVFIPMMLIRPEADIPIVQVSILQNQDSATHYEIGKVLHQFRKEGIAIIGSGLSYHNMKRFKTFRNDSDNSIENKDFDNFLTKVCTGDEETRHNIVFWEEQPSALESHPKGEADHLMPLIVNAGAGGVSKGRKVFQSPFYDKFLLSGFIWD